MAVYKVEGPNGKPRLIEARTKAQAILHVAAGDYKAGVISAGEAIQLSKSGMELEQVSKDIEASEDAKPKAVKAPKPADAPAAEGMKVARRIG